ncbi:ABC transporter ATP-binding protein [Roseibium sp. M-1]
MALSLLVENLTVRSPRGRALLTVDRFSAEPGETVGLRGPSGAGKSTLLYALAGLQSAVSGRVLWGGTDLAALSGSARAAFRRDYIGLVFQDFLLFEELSALGNAALATAFAPAKERKSIRSTAGALLSRLGVPREARTVDSFSGGERQRTAIARALAGNPEIILADEPTASLDRATADALIADLITLTRTERKTLIVVSHDTHLLDHMDRVIELADGRLLTEADRA